VDIATSVDNCGGCGNKCERASATAACVDQKCVFTCESGFHECSGACVYDGDTDHCGASCTECPASDTLHVDATCISGACGQTCSDGWYNCDLDKSNGCEHFGSCPVAGTSSGGTTSGGTTSGTTSPCGCSGGTAYDLSIQPLILCTLTCTSL
jgi:hypothetical protein